MHTYEVWVRSTAYHGKTPLTYTSPEVLLPGSIVRINLRRRDVIGVIKRTAPAPKGISLKPIEAVISADRKLPLESLRLLDWMNSYYPASSGSISQLFLPSNWPAKPRTQAITHTAKSSQPLPSLTNKQQQAVDTILQHEGTTILHGDTATGKTRIYIELLQHALRRNKSGLVLVPEIGLTTHLLTDLSVAFSPSTLKVIHSGLTPAQRRAVWQEILENPLPQIIIGPRSALFAPFKNLGCIIVDECHDDSYKQDNAPQYHALRVASRLGFLHNARVIFGSATPQISDIYIANQKDIPILRLTERAITQASLQTETSIVNRLDKKEFSQSSALSNTLIEAIREQLTAKQQSLLFLNRRGSARIIMCPNCGWRARCPHCDLPLTLHEDTFLLRCHTCGYKTNAPSACPECSYTDILFLGPGTKALEKECRHLFENATIARFDGDNLTSERLDKQVERIKDGKIDIIIGTQILVKGFDIPRLGLVGVTDADTSLSFPDFTAEERTYQLISQAIGRVGRGHVHGRIIIQTLDPDSRLIQQAINKNWDDFYSDQIAHRKTHGFPPFSFLLKLEVTRKSRAAAQRAATALKAQLLSREHISILGPTPSFYEQHKGNYRWQLVVKSPYRSSLLAIASSLPSGWRHDIDPTHLL